MQIKHHPPESLIAPPQIRKDLGTPEELEELKVSVGRYGILQPIGIRRDKTLVFGFRRLHVARMIGLKEVPTVELPDGQTETDYLMMQATENLARKDLTEPEVFGLCEQLLALNPSWTQKELAAHLGKHESTVSRIMSVRNLSPEMLRRFREGAFGFKVAAKLAVVPHDEQAERLKPYLEKGSIAAMDAEEKGRRASRSDTTKLPSITIALPESRKLVLKGGIDLATAKSMLATATRLVEKAIDDNIGAKVAQGLWKGTAKKKPKVSKVSKVSKDQGSQGFQGFQG